jgi:hypothetical protein
MVPVIVSLDDGVVATMLTVYGTTCFGAMLYLSSAPKDGPAAQRTANGSMIQYQL